MPRPEHLLTIRDLRVAFHADGAATEVTHGVDLHVEAGEVVALVGESGSGKTVTAMSITDLLPSNARRAGSIRFDGEELLTADPQRIRAIRGDGIAVIFQEPMTALNPVYTIGDHLVEAVSSHRSLSRAEAVSRAVALLEQVGLPDPERMLRRYPHEVSGGQRQRAMIAMAISAEPRLLVADEPTTALDVTVQAGILDLLLRLREELGMAILLITHDMGVVADVADRVVVMQDGAVVDRGDLDEVFYRSSAPYTRRLLAAVPDLDVASEGQAVPPATAAGGDAAAASLAVRELRVEYRSGWRRPRFTAVDGVSFEVGSGEVVGLVGESGSGKSTIGRAVLGLIPIASGQVTVAGVDLVGADRSALRLIRRDVSVVFQDPGSSLNPRVTVGRSITDPLRWTGLERDEGVLRTRAAELLEQVRLPAGWASRYPHELSGGQRQRVGIARAIATNPRFMVADEPTSALDVSVQATVLDLLQELQRTLGFSCLFISHDLAVVERIANRVLVLRSGRIVEQGTARDILRSPSESYTKALIAAVPLPDPRRQRERRRQRLAAGA